MINGAHIVIYSRDAEADRAFFRDVLGWPHVNAGRGWLIFRTPPAELALHPTDEGAMEEVMLMCDDLDATIADLTAKGVRFTHPVSDQKWGRVTAFHLPGGGELALYQPLHPRPEEG